MIVGIVIGGLVVCIPSTLLVLICCGLLWGVWFGGVATVCRWDWFGCDVVFGFWCNLVDFSVSFGFVGYWRFLVF